jgi:hypothetical protein
LCRVVGQGPMGGEGGLHEVPRQGLRLAAGEVEEGAEETVHWGPPSGTRRGRGGGVYLLEGRRQSSVASRPLLEGPCHGGLP